MQHIAMADGAYLTGFDRYHIEGAAIGAENLQFIALVIAMDHHYHTDVASAKLMIR